MWKESEGVREVQDNEAKVGRSSSGSEVVIMDRAVAAPASAMPNVASLSVTKSSRVHIGPKFVSVTQTVHNGEVIKGRFLGLELVSPKNSRRLRCSVAIFVCWTLVVACGLTFYLLRFAIATEQTRLDLGIAEPWYLRRADWQALAPYSMKFLELPVPNVIIGHSAGSYCVHKYKCINQVLNIQKDHLGLTYADIGPNFLVGGNGLIFEGRGANVLGAMVISWNTKSISIMFLGDYSTDKSNKEQFEHVNILLDTMVKLRVLRQDYVVYGHCQVSPHTISPGLYIMNSPLPCYIWKIIKSSTKAERLSCVAALLVLVTCIALIVYFTIHAKRTEAEATDTSPHEWIISRQMWLAQKYVTEETTHKFEPLRLVIIQHTVGSECHRFITCAAHLRSLQGWFITSHKYDIPYNFLVGNDGRIYEGRGWGIEGAHTRRYNRCSIGIGFMGDYREEMTSFAKVSEQQVNRTRMLLEEGVSLGYLHPEYHVVGARDLKVTESPGSNLYNAIRTWEHYDHNHIYKDKTCEEIQTMFNTTN